MQENVGTVDRWLRVGVGGSLVLAGAFGLQRGKVGPALMLTSGALILESALTRVCPVNALLGVDTRAEGAAKPRLTSPNATPSAPRVTTPAGLGMTPGVGLDERLVSDGAGEDG